MTLDPEKPNVERRPWWTLLECSAPEGWLVTFSLVQFAESPRQAAEQSAGFQMADNWRPRRILVHPEPPYVYEWVQIRPYIMSVGKEEERRPWE